MSFYLYDITFLVLFGTFLSIFLYRNRKNLKREGIMLLYRTQLGIKFINYLSKKYKGLLKRAEYVLIVSGYLLMIGGLLLFVRALYLFTRPEFVQTFKIPPIMPLIPYIPELFKVDFLPPLYFSYFIVILAVAAIPHEFFHGLFAKVRNVKLKSTGFAFLGPFAGAFVEPDEDKVEKMKPRKKIPFLCAGTFANILMTILFFLLLWLFAVSAYSPQGVVFGSYASNVLPTENITIKEETLHIEMNGGLNLTKIKYKDKNYYATNSNKSREYIMAFQDTPALRSGLAGVITRIGDKEVREFKDMREALNSYQPGSEVTIETRMDGEKREYSIELIGRPNNKSQAYLGISPFSRGGFGGLKTIRSQMLFFRNPYTYYKPRVGGELTIFIFNLLWWVVLASFGVALVNMLPLGIFDGGRMFYSTVVWVTGSKKVAKKAYSIATYAILGVFIMLMYLWFINTF